jgi:Putative zinc-finger
MSERPLFGALGHPDVETLAAFVDHMMDVRARGDVERHLAGCEECHEWVCDVVRARDVEEGLASLPDAPRLAAFALFVGSSWVIGTIAGLAAAAGLVAAICLYRLAQ